MTTLAIRFDQRIPPFSTTTHAEQYRACLEMCAWADEHGFTSAIVSEHHGVDDGYLPAPLTLASTILGRAPRLVVTVSALLLPLHDPVRIAEQIAVMDLASEGRLVTIAGLGYRDEEFQMAGVSRKGRGKLLEEQVRAMLAAWTGEPFQWQGRTVRVTPRPLTQPHPILAIGGSTEVAARRAARLGLPFFAAVGDPALGTVYEEACRAEGFTGGWAMLPHGPGFVHVTDDPERDWARIAPHALYDAQTYASWQTPGQRSEVHVDATTTDELRASGVYRVVTPEECVALAAEVGTVLFHPLMGGMSPEFGWESLELFAAKVLPRLT